MPPARSSPTIVVVGIGNELSGDDAAGLRVARTLKHEPLPPHVSVYEAGMAGFRLIDLWMDSDLCIVVDAMDAGEAPGTVREFDAGEVVSSVFPEQELSVSSHGARLKEALELGGALGPPYIPRDVRVFGIQMDPGQGGLGTAGLSPCVEQACREVITRIHELWRTYRRQGVVQPGTVA